MSTSSSSPCTGPAAAAAARSPSSRSRRRSSRSTRTSTSSSGRWPPTSSTRTSRGYDDGFIDVCLFNGCIRNSENEYIANLLRQKSKVLVAFGSCATHGRHPGPGQRVDGAQELKELVYTQNPSIDNPEGVIPQETWEVPEGELDLPHLYDTVKTLDQVRRRRLLHAGLPARGAPDRGGARRRDRRAQGRGRAAAQGRRRRRRPQDLLRRVQAGQGREEDRRLPAHLGVPARPREVPARAGRRLHGSGDPRRLRRALHHGRHALPRLLRRRPRASSTRAPRCSARWPRSSTRRRPRRSPRSPPRCPTRSAPSTGSGSPVRCSGGRRSDEEDIRRSHHPPRGPRQDRDLRQRRRRGRQRLLPDPRAARLRALLRRPPGRGAGAHHAAHLRRLPRGAPHRRHQGDRRRLRRRGRAGRPQAARAALQRLLRHRPHDALLRARRPRLRRRARRPTRPSATSSASSTRSVSRPAGARHQRCAPRPPSSSA